MTGAKYVASKHTIEVELVNFAGLEQFGGANGELAAAMQYSIQGLIATISI